MSICMNKVKIDGHTVQLFKDEESGKITGYRFSGEGKYYDDPLNLLPAGYKPIRTSKTWAEVEDEMKEIDSYQTKAFQRISLRTMERFGVKSGVSEADGTTTTTLHYPYTKEDGKVQSGYKNKLLNPKKFWSTGKTEGDVDFFGWKQALEANSPRIYITEGENDTLALYEMLRRKNRGTKWEDQEIACVSLPRGVSDAKTFISKKEGKLNKHFKDIILVFDTDEKGVEASTAVATIMPTVKVAELPMKDAFECLHGGVVKRAVSAVLFNASKPKNTRLVKGSTLREAARKEAEWGLTFPWTKLTDLTRGRRYGETRYWGAGVKMGKSELVNALAAHHIREYKTPVLLVKPEEAKVKSYQMLVSKMAGKVFHDPKVPFDFEAYDKYEPMVGDLAIIVDSYQFVDWDTLKGDIRYAVTGEGVRDIIIDPITALTNQISSGEANDFLVSMTAELSSMAKDLKFGVDIFCHLKAPPNNQQPHERGGEVLSTQFAGSRAMMRACNYMIGLQGNKDPSLPIEQRNLRDLIVLEDREFGNTGVVPLYWDMKTALFNQL